MTQAQKNAKAKFKQAIAYRQKTGVSLKEAFAHIYGKKVGAVKKKSAPKKKAAKKIVKKKYGLNTKLDKLYSAKKPGKRVSKSGKTYYENRVNRSDKGKVYGVRSTIKKLIKVAPQVKKNIKRIVNKKLQNTRSYFGIETKNDLILKRIKEASSDLNTYYNYIDDYKNLSMQDKKNRKVQYKHIANLIKETNTHIKELKKSL